MANYTSKERRIAKELRITPHGLVVLGRLRRGDQISGNNTGTRLERDGLVTPHDPWKGKHRELTPAGEEVYQTARMLGW